ncbi:hypothetical protein ACLB1O_18115 [Escherichia coli]
MIDDWVMPRVCAFSRRRRRKKGQRSSLKGGGSVLVVGNVVFRRVYSATEKMATHLLVRRGREKPLPRRW